MTIIDTHLHLVYPQKFSYPWLAGAPAINRPWSVESYFAEAMALGIEAALHMEVDVAPTDIVDESAFVLTLPGIAGAIAAARPEEAGFPAQLDELLALGGVRGIRRILHVVPNELSQTMLFAENLQRIADHGLTFDLCARADQLLPVAVPLIEKLPDLQFILDHCGNPDIANNGFDLWRDGIAQVAALPNVVCKVSGIIAYGGPNPTVDMLRPYFEQVVESFGWDRLVWGSDHPVCTLTANLTTCGRWYKLRPPDRAQVRRLRAAGRCGRSAGGR